MLTALGLGCYVTSNGSALMAHPDKPFPAMLMAERERTNPSRGVLLRVLAF
jgi:hypothetical protein